MRAARLPVGVAAAALILFSRASTGSSIALELEPCHLELLAEEVQCGVHDVYEDREAGHGRRISIRFAVLPALRRAAAPDPLFVLAGGPGQGAQSFAPIATRYFKQVRRTRAIVLVDLRGTGRSHPLDCGSNEDEIERLRSGGDLFLGRQSDCLRQLDADVRHYTHASALADLDEIRQRLGFASINLWGGSWGTRAALFYALRYPDVVRSVVLDGAAPLDLGFPRTVARDAERGLNLLVERCAAEAACRTAFPAARLALDALLERLSAAPPTVSVKHPRTAAAVSLTLTRDIVAEIIRVGLYTTTDAARLLQTIQHATAGDFAPLIAQYVHSATMTTDEMALGATMSVLCSEDMPLVADTDFESEAQGTFVGTGYADAWRSRCVGWPVGPTLTTDHRGISGAAALILSGQTDPVTPPQRGDAMARHFPRHLHLVVPGAAHNASFTGCVPDLIAAFLDHGDATPLDASCIVKASLPSIVLDDAGGRP